MDKQVKAYLSELDGQLNYLSEVERRDIMEEVGSHIYERIVEGSEIEEVLAGFGNPKELAKSYGSEVIVKNTKFNLKSLITMIKFSFVVGIKGMFVIPFVAISSLAFYASSIIIVLGVVLKGISGLFGIDLPFVILDFGFWQAPYWLAMISSFLVAGLLYITSRKLWGFLKVFLYNISLSYRKLS